jgi:hypothetical protein
LIAASRILLIPLIVGGQAAACDDVLRPILATDGQAVELAFPRQQIDAIRLHSATHPIESGLTVFVDGSNTAILGRLDLSADAIRFSPRYSFRSGTKLLIRLVPEHLGIDGQPREWTLDVPRTDHGGPPRIEAIYPSGPELPENLLRIYLQFSQPMSRGQAYESIHLVDQTERAEVKYAFLELGEELWDPSGTRFTLLLDPGRIKRGLVPREEMGPILRPGHDYALTISSAWRSASGLPLARDFTHEFRAIAEDTESPNPQSWMISTVRAGTKHPLQISFDQPLDRALAARLIRVVNGSRVLRGRVDVGKSEMAWSFTPEAPWVAGDHELVVDTDLEDPAGNRVGQRFEVDLLDKIESKVEAKSVVRSFRVE